MNINAAMMDKLIDIRDVNIDLSMPIDKRIKSYTNQIKNPYLFKYKNYIITIEYIGDNTLEHIIISQSKT